MTPDDARQYCEERGIRPALTRDERLALSKEDFRMFALAYPPINPHPSTAARIDEAMEIRIQAEQLRQASGL